MIFSVFKVTTEKLEELYKLQQMILAMAGGPDFNAF